MLTDVAAGPGATPAAAGAPDAATAAALLAAADARPGPAGPSTALARARVPGAMASYGSLGSIGGDASYYSEDGGGGDEEVLLQMLPSSSSSNGSGDSGGRICGGGSASEVPPGPFREVTAAQGAAAEEAGPAALSLSDFVDLQRQVGGEGGGAWGPD